MKKIYLLPFIASFLLLTSDINSIYSFNESSKQLAITFNFVPFGNIPKAVWPAQVFTGITGVTGIDSVWVRWYKNNTSTGVKSFKLTYYSSSGVNYYWGYFNSDTTQVAVNDSIYYRVIAQDNSSAHNRDSTVLYSFKLTAGSYGIIGTGAAAIGYPFYTFYMDSRTQMIFTANEILAAGIQPNSIFSKIAFKVGQIAPQTMNGLSIKMQNTAATSFDAFVNTGWAEVYSGNYSVSGTFWQMFSLQNLFLWNGQNLAVEVCFHNTSWTLNSYVLGGAAPNQVWHQHVDNNNGCTLQGGALQTNRPMICLGYGPYVGIKAPQTNLPDKFSLSQNYPNPFNPSTIINYNIPVSSRGGMIDVKLSVFDILGREIAVLVNQKQNAGSYEIEFDGSNYASGLYYYKLTAGSFIDVKKMVLVK